MMGLMGAGTYVTLSLSLSLLPQRRVMVTDVTVCMMLLGRKKKKGGEEDGKGLSFLVSYHLSL